MRWRVVVVAAACVAGVVLGAVPAGSAAAPPRPATVPALQRWTPSAGGSWTPANPARVVVTDDVLAAEAEQLAGDLRRLLRRPVAVAAGTAAGANAGDVVLARTAPERQLGAEGYRLRVRTTFAIAAPTTTGVFYGGRTLLQLLRQAPSVPWGDAADWPRHRDRGLMLDLGRIAFSPAFIESHIVRLASLKLNLLHLHLTDDQRWGIHSERHPELASPGALSRADLARLLAVARRHHVRVVPEIDLPGHSQALLRHHPDLQLKVAGVLTDREARAYVFDKLDIGNPKATALVRDLLDEFVPLFPDRYFHLGVDEYISPAQYPLYPDLTRHAVARYGPGATPADAIWGFVNDVNRQVRSYGKQLVIWNDQLAGGSGRVVVDADVVVQWWSSVSPVGDTVTVPPRPLLERGHDLLNAGVFPTYYAEDIGPAKAKSSMRHAYEQWDLTRFCGPATTGDVNTPCYDVPEAVDRIRGSTINVWGPTPETPAQIAAGIWPRLVVIAQKTWASPPLTRSYDTFRRLTSGATG